MGLFLKWIKSNGGSEGMAKRCQEKSSIIYHVIDNSKGFYYNPTDVSSRSRLTIPFRVGGPKGNDELEKKFLTQAENHGMIQLKGHRSVGGIRASLYNAMSVEETQVLADFMVDFQNNNQLQ